MASREFNRGLKLDVPSNFLHSLVEDVLPTSTFLLEYFLPFVSLFFGGVSWSSNLVERLESSRVCNDINFTRRNTILEYTRKIGIEGAIKRAVSTKFRSELRT